MAVTGFWPVFKNLKATLDYADNPDKTTAPEYLDEDVYAALRYAENGDKTDRKMFVGGINCSAQNAYAEMIAVQRRFGLRGKVVGYHGIQSFREGEVTPEQAFEIGKETARRMWGERYQVLVTVHLNTDNIRSTCCFFSSDIQITSFPDSSSQYIRTIVSGVHPASNSCLPRFSSQRRSDRYFRLPAKIRCSFCASFTAGSLLKRAISSSTRSSGVFFMRYLL